MSNLRANVSYARTAKSCDSLVCVADISHLAPAKFEWKKSQQQTSNSVAFNCIFLTTLAAISIWIHTNLSHDNQNSIDFHFLVEIVNRTSVHWIHEWKAGQWFIWRRPFHFCLVFAYSNCVPSLYLSVAKRWRDARWWQYSSHTVTRIERCKTDKAWLFLHVFATEHLFSKRLLCTHNRLSIQSSAETSPFCMRWFFK